MKMKREIRWLYLSAIGKNILEMIKLYENHSSLKKEIINSPNCPKTIKRIYENIPDLATPKYLLWVKKYLNKD